VEDSQKRFIITFVSGFDACISSSITTVCGYQSSKDDEIFVTLPEVGTISTRPETTASVLESMV
jgi:hypothetical protein